MPKQNSRELLIKLAGAVIAGLTTRTVNLNGNLADITSIDASNPGGTVWREVIAGIQMMDIDGNGYFEDKAQTITFIEAKNDGTYLDLEIVVPGLGSFAADFAVGNLGLAAELEGAVTMSLQLQSSGPVTFTAAV